MLRARYATRGLRIQFFRLFQVGRREGTLFSSGRLLVSAGASGGCLLSVFRIEGGGGFRHLSGLCGVTEEEELHL